MPIEAVDVATLPDVTAPAPAPAPVTATSGTAWRSHLSK
jgi:hypothetical protein